MIDYDRKLGFRGKAVVMITGGGIRLVAVGSGGNAVGRDRGRVAGAGVWDQLLFLCLEWIEGGCVHVIAGLLDGIKYFWVV